jgi:putative two-component system response regulator
MIEMIYKSAPLHDIGKVGIPDRILLRPGRFEPAEFEIMKTHTTLGRDAIQAAEDTLGLKVEFLSIAKEIAYGHQEKWDGSGYPEALSGDLIPVSARIMAVADVYDALISRRVYKDGMPHEKAVTNIAEGRGTHFDHRYVGCIYGNTGRNCGDRCPLYRYRCGSRRQTQSDRNADGLDPASSKILAMPLSGVR